MLEAPIIELPKNYPTQGIEGTPIEAFYPVAKYTIAHYYLESDAIRTLYIVYSDNKHLALGKVYSKVGGQTFGKIKVIKTEPNPDRLEYLKTIK